MATQRLGHGVPSFNRRSGRAARRKTPARHSRSRAGAAGRACGNRRCACRPETDRPRWRSITEHRSSSSASATLSGRKRGKYVASGEQARHRDRLAKKVVCHRQYPRADPRRREALRHAHEVRRGTHPCRNQIAARRRGPVGHLKALRLLQLAFKAAQQPHAVFDLRRESPRTSFPEG